MKLTINDKVVNIPDKEIENLKNSLGVSTDEAVEIWCDDNDITVNEEQNALDEKAKTVKINLGAKDDKKERKKSDKPKTVKVSDEKTQIFSEIVAFLSEKYDISVVTANKLLEINLNGKNFKLNLSETRAKK